MLKVLYGTIYGALPLRGITRFAFLSLFSAALERRDIIHVSL